MTISLQVERTYRTDMTTRRSERIVEGICVPYGVAEEVSDDGLTRYLEEWQAGVFRSMLEPANRGRVKLNFTHDESSPFTWIGRALMLTESAEGLVGQFKVDESPFGDAALAKADDGQLPGLSISAIVRANIMRGAVKVRTEGHLRHVALVEQPAFAGALVTAVREAFPYDKGGEVPAPDPVRRRELSEWLRSQKRR